jgi:hypothetical protein
MFLASHNRYPDLDGGVGGDFQIGSEEAIVTELSAPAQRKPRLLGDTGHALHNSRVCHWDLSGGRLAPA